MSTKAKPGVTMHFLRRAAQRNETFKVSDFCLWTQAISSDFVRSRASAASPTCPRPRMNGKNIEMLAPGPQNPARFHREGRRGRVQEEMK